MTVRLLLPPGYPAACPADFWVAPAIAPEWARGQRRIQKRMYRADEVAYEEWDQNARPKGSGERWLIPGDGEVWGQGFKLRLQAWNPNRDTIYTWSNVVRMRLAAIR